MAVLEWESSPLDAFTPIEPFAEPLNPHFSLNGGEPPCGVYVA